MVDDKSGDTDVANAATVTGEASPTSATAATVAGPMQGQSLSFELPPPGYTLGALLGKGGMGEVLLAQDIRVGREVAYKRMRETHASTDALGRFLREARIQARLDHPAIVPVYEMGKDVEGRPYFTMKRLAGKTLAERLAQPDEPRQPLLRAFAEVCLAVELAHSKSVVHRDLKPQNVMLGDFGEVYVLDWGVARVDAEQSPASSITGTERRDIDSIGEHTSDGTMLGTLGYMPPEQMRGQPVTPAADVYALGSILFEILAGEPLHPRGHPAVQSTLSMETDSPAKRRPERAIAPELDALCTQAVQADPAKRPTARQLAERVQAFLDGDRDLERRRDLANEYLAAAREALASGDPTRRAESLRAAGRALALQPESADAAELVTSLILSPPDTHPPELEAALEASEVEMARGRGLKAVTSYLGLLSLAVLLVWFDVHDWTWLVGIIGGIAGFIAISWATYKTGRIFTWQVLLGTVVMAILFSRLASPYVLVPALICGTAMSVSNIPALNERSWLLYVWIVIAGVVPQVCEWLGLITPTTHLENGHIVLDSAVFGAGGQENLIALFVANAMFLAMVMRFGVVLARDRRTAQRNLIVQAWHLHQLLPKTALLTRRGEAMPA
jgi:eukaryotic-like serine/threonine-protein kinase